MSHFKQPVGLIQRSICRIPPQSDGEHTVGLELQQENRIKKNIWQGWVAISCAIYFGKGPLSPSKTTHLCPGPAESLHDRPDWPAIVPHSSGIKLTVSVILAMQSTGPGTTQLAGMQSTMHPWWRCRTPSANINHHQPPSATYNQSLLSMKEQQP